MRSFDVKSGENEEHSAGPQPLLFGIYFSPNLKRRMRGGVKVFWGEIGIFYGSFAYANASSSSSRGIAV